MSKIANYLSEHLKGEVLTNPSLRQRFSKDGSILQITPLIVAFVFNTNDVRKLVHFAWQLAEKGHVLPLTARGSGSSNTGAAIGSGVVASFEKYFTQILEVDTKQKLVRLQPGVSIKALQAAMETHGLTWPVDSHSHSATVGGAIANGLYSERGGKHGSAGMWVDQLEVVLASGDIIQTKRLSKRELNKKKGLNTTEGEIYRQLDHLLTDHESVVADLAARPGSTGYDLASVKTKNSFDLTPLIVGSQGTLGMITEAIVRLDHHRPQTEVIAASLGSLDELEQLLQTVAKYSPARVDFIDAASLAYATDKLGLKLPELQMESEESLASHGLLLVEMTSEGRMKSKIKKVIKQLERGGHSVVRSGGDFEVAADMKQAYSRMLTLLNYIDTDDHKTAVPIIEDALVPVRELTAFTKEVYAIAKKHRVSLLLWAHASTGVIHVRPRLNIRNLSDKQKLQKLVDDYYKLVVKYDGSVAGEYAEGRLRAQVAATQFSKAENELFVEVKKIFDVYGIFNPGVKLPDQPDPLKFLNENYTH